MDQFEKQHQGEVIQIAIKRSGYPIATIVQKLNLSRSTLYGSFKKATLDPAFLLALGEVIHYDFTRDFPQLGAKKSVAKKRTLGRISEIIRLEKRYQSTKKRHEQFITFMQSISLEKGSNS